MNDNKREKAVALKYDHGVGGAPTVTAKGRGKVAKKIIDLAKAHQVPLVEDNNLVNMLDALDIDTEIPDTLYRAVAEVLVFVYRMNRSQ